MIVGDDARVDDLDANHVRGAGERPSVSCLVADMGVIGDVAGRAGEDERRIGRMASSMSVTAGRSSQRHASFGGVARLPCRVGDHHRDDVADMMASSAAITG